MLPSLPSSSLRALLLLLLLLRLPLLGAASSAQFCKFGHLSNQVDFCSSLTAHRNSSTGDHNLYLTFTHTRPLSSGALGWAAVGFGSQMAGALMVVVYGDPASDAPPIVSVRASTGHSQPTLLTRAQLAGGDLRVLRSDWRRSDADATATAVVSLVCYSCTRWPGTRISAAARSQPLIWAWNRDQRFDVFAYDAHLRMHAHHAGNGGWGRFYVDMPRATSAVPQLPSVPFIRPGVAAWAASESPDLLRGGGGVLSAVTAWARRDPAPHAHGALMAAAFLLLLPAGVVALRLGRPRSFAAHWVLQLAAGALVLAGTGVGASLRGTVDTPHQVLGLSVVGALAVQAGLGYKHHVDFVRIRRRTWISHAHVWTGRAAMAAACANLVLGMRMRGYAPAVTGLAAGFAVLEMAGLAAFVWRRGRAAAEREERKVAFEEAERRETARTHRYFAIGDDSDGEQSDAESESGKLCKEEEEGSAEAR